MKMINLSIRIFFILNMLLIFQSTGTMAIDSNATIPCLCSYEELIELDKLNTEYKRIRIDKSNGTKKYEPVDLVYYKNSTGPITIDCKSIVTYEILNDLDKINNRPRRKCRTCTRLGWSDVKTCSIMRCDRDWLIGKPVLKKMYNQEYSSEVKLFEVMLF
jgi:hypothetical protein